MQNVVIKGTGSYIPEIVIKNEYFLEHKFYDENRVPYDRSNEEIIQKFKDITGIEERRWASSEFNNSDLGYFAAKKAIENSRIDPETLDYIITGHNVGDINHGSNQTDLIPCLASRIKQKLQIRNKNTVAFDVIFGCPGWIQGVISAYAYMKSGLARNALVIGTETLSRTIDHYDRDSMIFADGAGATVFELLEEDAKRGILAVAAKSDTLIENDFLKMGKTYGKINGSTVYFIKMAGRKIYEYALLNVPVAMKETLEMSGVDIREVKKIFIHQANEKWIMRSYKDFLSCMA